MSPLWIRWHGCKFLVISSRGVCYLVLGGRGCRGSPPAFPICVTLDQGVV